MAAASSSSPFMEWFRKRALAYCEEHHRNAPAEDWFAAAASRIPAGLKETITIGLRDGTIGEMGGHQFVPEGAAEPRHYSWFLGSGQDGPYVWWEAFIHAAEFSRVKALASKHNLKVGFEDHWMDITLYRDGKLLACYEVKEKRQEAELLIEKVGDYGKDGIRLDDPDHHNDPLRKTKYLVRHRPEYLSVVAIGCRWEFSISYREVGARVAFDLIPDVIPIG